MLSSIPDILMPVLAMVAVVFLLLRLRYFSSKDIGGRYLFLSGAVIVVIAASWQWVRLVDTYESWFIITAYPVIDVVQFVLLLAGVLLLVAGISLYADFWQIRRDDIERREGKLTVLENLQKDARQPYQLMELLNIALKDILVNFEGSAGAVFLINRKRRQIVLTASAGLNKREIAHLEYYPLDGNIVNQSVELGEPIIAGEFSMIDRNGKQISSRFRATLVLPLISGLDKIGGILLFSPEEKYFNRSDIKTLSPVAEWLAEKIKSARLTRALSVSKREVDKWVNLQADMTGRLLAASESLSSRESVKEFCTALIGVASSQSAHLFGIKYGTLHFYGGSEPLFDLSESYKSALIDALGKRKPLIINQEANDENGHTRVVLSSLIVPFGREGRQEALLFRRDSSTFRIDDQQLKSIDIFTHLAALILTRNATDQLAITRRMGFEKVLELLQLDSEHDVALDPGHFVQHLSTILPERASAITFVQNEEGLFEATSGFRVDGKALTEFSIGEDEGGVSEAATSMQARFSVGRTSVASHLESYESENRNAFSRVFGEDGTPSFIACCPVLSSEGRSIVAVFLLYRIDETERGEWERLLTLASGLYSLRLAINAAGRMTELAAEEELPPVSQPQALLNKLNNHLSAIIGQAELAGRTDDLSEKTQEYLDGIINEAEKSGKLISSSITASSDLEQGVVPAATEEGLNRIIGDMLDEINISGDLFMAAGRPREINLVPGEVEPVAYSPATIRKLFDGVLNRFTAIASEDDVITVETYQSGDYVYLDVSRHAKNFPSVKSVSEFGEYLESDQALKNRPSDVFLSHLIDGQSFYAVDRSSPAPTFLSFKFPVSRIGGIETRVKEEPTIRILAIDDEALILDLIAAMCQTLGYEVDTAGSGEEGIEKFAAREYDMVLTDLAMPGMSGLTVARIIRQKSPEIPIILVTGWEASLDRDKIDESGVTQTLYKPFRIEQLTEVIQSLSSTKN